MPGELIYGGKQDRCMAEEAVVPPDGKPLKINVYCVEHGRWNSRPETEAVRDLAALEQSPGENLDQEKLRKQTAEIQKGKFVASAGSLNKEGRVAVQEGKGQAEVWNTVGKINSAAKNSSDSGDFAAIYTRTIDPQQLQAYVKELQEKVSNHPQVVGAIVAINGKVEAVDIFQSTPLFQKIWPKLLKSHALDAITAPKTKTTNDCTLEDAEKFLATAMHEGEEQKSKTQDGMIVTKRDSPSVVSFSVHEKDTAPSAQSFGGSVHSSGYSK